PAQVSSNACEPEPRHIVPGHTVANRLRRVGVSHSARSQAIEPKDRLVVCVVNCEERFRGTGFMTLAGVTLQKVINGRIATVERFPIMLFRDRLFVPGGKAHPRFRVGFGIAAMAARSLAFGTGGFSRRFSTKRLSRSDKTMRSDSSITDLASRKAGCRTKSVRSVCLNAAARISMAFCSGRSRRFIRLLSSTATLGI